MKIGVVLPSRGIMFSKTMESVFNNVKGLDDVSLYMAHGRPIPDCFNEPLNKALKEGCDAISFVEEDMDIPSDTLRKFIASEEPVITTDYADRRTGVPLILRDTDDNVIFSGMGCMLVRREVFEKMEKPYVKPMVFWKVQHPNGDIEWEPHPEIPFNGYGGQDLGFCHKIRKAGYRITEYHNIKIGHMMLVAKSEDIINNGGDVVKTTYITKDDNPPK